MKCHYEVLDISKDADDSEIKSAYRKLALKWHPDKNLDKQDFAKEQFQLVQQAYEVLSDRQERAWYDAHRDQILRGASSEFQDNSLDVFQYFTTTCFKGYADDEGGFYTIYRKVFEQIAKEDIEFMEEKEDFCEIPGFGKSDSDYETVKSFYDYWMSYTTKKSYSWLDPYDIREGKGDRRLLKLIDKENKKARQKAKKERNEEIRNLVAFVRKRDKRVQAFKKEIEAKTLENRKKQEELSKQKRLERKQLHASEKQADWLKFDNVKSELEEIEKHLAQEFGEELSESEEEEDFNNLYCVACNKVFKNPRAFENHEISKKHKENIEKLKQSMLEEEDVESNCTENVDEYDDIEENDENLDNIIDENGQISGDESIGSDDNLSEICGTQKKKKKRKNRNRKIELYESEESGTCDNEDNQVKVSDTSEQDAEPGKTNDEVNHIDISKISDDDFDFSLKKNQKKKNKKGNNKVKASVVLDKEEVQEKMDENVILENNFEPVNDQVCKNKKSAKKEKKSKKDTCSIDPCDIDISHCCVTCKNNFPSKNKLFEHLKKTGHGVYLPQKAKQTIKKK